MRLKPFSRAADTDKQFPGGEVEVLDSMAAEVKFTFDTKAPSPVQDFHMPSLVQDRELQKVASRLTIEGPHLVTVRDYTGLTREFLLDALETIKVARNLRERFVDYMTTITQLR